MPRSAPTKEPVVLAGGGDSAPLLAGEGSRVGHQHLDADMVGAGRTVLCDPAHDGAFVAPGDDRVEEPIAHLREIVFGESAAQQIIGVVRQRQIRPKPIGSDAACLVDAVT
jgi:hypothetical protein